MHLFGVGFTISATILTAALALVWARPLPARTHAAIVTVGALTLAHAGMMARNAQPTRAGVVVSLADQFDQAGALFMGSIQAGARSLWANGRFPWPKPDSYPTDAAYGYALLLALAATSAILLWKGRTEQRTVLLAAGLLVGIFAFSTTVYSTLIVYRLQQAPEMAAINPFLFGTRYVIFPAFFIFLLSPLLLIGAARSLGALLVPPASLLAGGAMVATHVFFTTVSTLWPILTTPFPVTWSTTIANAKLRLRNDGYIHDRNMAQLGPEFYGMLSDYSELLEHELGCRGCVRFTPPR